MPTVYQPSGIRDTTVCILQHSEQILREIRAANRDVKETTEETRDALENARETLIYVESVLRSERRGST